MPRRRRIRAVPRLLPALLGLTLIAPPAAFTAHPSRTLPSPVLSSPALPSPAFSSPALPTPVILSPAPATLPLRDVLMTDTARSPVTIGLWFDEDSFREVADDTSAWKRLTGSSIALAAYRGDPATLLATVERRTDAATQPATAPPSDETRWVEAIEWIPVSTLAYRWARAADPDGRLIERRADSTALATFRSAWDATGLRVRQTVDLIHPHLLDSATAGYLRASPSGRPALFPGGWLVRPAQYRVAVTLRSGAGPVLLECYEPTLSDCLRNRPPRAMTTGDPALTAAGEWPDQVVLHPSADPVSGLRQVDSHADRMALQAGGLLLVEGAWWVHRLAEVPDLDLAVQDLAAGRRPVIPLATASAATHSANYSATHAAAGRDEIRSRSGLHLLTLVIFFAIVSLIRRDPYYSQRLYRFFVNISFLELEQQDRRVNRWTDHILLVIIASVITGTMGTIVLTRILSPSGLLALREAIPFATREGSGSMEVFTAWSAFALATQSLSLFWIWASHRGRVPVRHILGLLAWPLHLQFGWLLALVALDGRISDTAALNLFSGFLATSLMIFVLANMNTARSSAGTRPLGSLAGSLAYLLFWLGILYLATLSELWRHWIPLAFSL